MFKKNDWQKLLALFIFIVLLGGYYEQLSVETQTMILPMVIILAAAFAIARFRQLEYEIRSSRIMSHSIAVQTFSVVDEKGKEHVTISADSDNASITFYDENRSTCATLSLMYKDPALKLSGDRGSAWIELDKDGKPNLTLRSDTDEIIWSAL
ncbi:hypothetical protein ACFL6B_03395 [Thermodesulfobacteriota bacterium]